MLAHFWSAVTWAILGLSSVAHDFGCGLRRCVYFLDHDYTPIVYTLDKDGLRSYAVAIAHATISRDHLPRVITGAIDGVPMFVTELSQTESFPMDLLNDPAGRELKHDLSPLAWTKLTEMFPSLHLGPPTLRPMVVYRMYTEKILGEAHGATSTADLIEVQLAGYARHRGKTVRALDHLRDVVTTLGESISPALLEWTLTTLDPSVIAESFGAQRAAFRRGDVDAVATASERASVALGTEVAFERLIVARNRSWAPRILDLHAEGPFALVVSATHFGGPDGLVALLGEAGFRVRRVHPAPN